MSGGNVARLLDYASCEQVFDAMLVARPVVVLSNNDGNVIARSNEAKQLGIKMGEPAFKVYGLFEEHDVQVLSSNYELYGDMSSRVADVIREFSPEVEVYSIDECFISLDPMQQYSLAAQGHAIREQVRRYTGIPVSVGIATTKTLAKIANYHAKRSMKANGCLDLTNSPLSQEAQYSNSITLELAPLTDTTPELMAMSLSGLAAIFRPGYRYKKAGVLLTNLVPAATLTMRLWGNEHNEKMRSLMEAMDSLNEKFGRDAVKVGLLAKQGKWRKRFGQRSPRYTTKWKELLQVA